MLKKLISKLSRHLSNDKPLLVVFCILFTSMMLLFGYNKYLDWQNVQDMKTLLADFEQLERDLEAETGEEFYIEASCGSVGKFATSYACSVALPIETDSTMVDQDNYSAAVSKYSSLMDCEILMNGKNNFKGAINCVVGVRESTVSQAESIFFEYDTSPGMPF